MGTKRPRDDDSVLEDRRSGDEDHRVIIALDIDAFYVAASRLRDPSLVGLPVGIKQKDTLATCSYEARERGVRKLASVAEGLRTCPELILVNGEDLSFFRRLSSQCWRLVRSIVWGAKVEKLGLDELFCDVTEMIDSHWRTQRQRDGSATQDQEFQFFVERDFEGCSPSFTYNDRSPVPRHVLPEDALSSGVHDSMFEASRLSTQQRRLLIGAHLANYIRNQVLKETGLTTSAGIAHNKVLAKFISSMHKPFHQTVLLPRGQADVTNLLDPRDARSLMGFGSITVAKLKEKLLGTAYLGQSTADSAVPLSIAMCRRTLSLDDWHNAVGHRLGTRLYNLVRGKDDEEVTPAPLYPIQISVEDTYPALWGTSIVNELRILSNSLLRRLEAELVDDAVPALEIPFERRDEPLELFSEQGAKGQVVAHRGVLVRRYIDLPATSAGTSSDSGMMAQRASRSWKRYPLTVRLSIRLNWKPRTSRQTKMPVEVFDLGKKREERADQLAAALQPVMRALIEQQQQQQQQQQQTNSSAAPSEHGLNLVNIAAVNLASRRPAPALGSFFGSGFGSPTKRATGGRAPEIGEAVDLATLSELPPDIRAEVARQYGIVEERSDPKSDATTIDLQSTRTADTSSIENLICERCGAVQEAWLQHDHLTWPIHGVPACFVPQRRDKRDDQSTHVADLGQDEVIASQDFDEKTRSFV